MRKTFEAAVVAITLLVSAPMLVSPEGLEAQQSRESCRCVDVDGNEIENCMCFRAPRIDGILGAIGFDSRPRLGISVEVTQGARYDAQGALVSDVMDGGPADDAGIRDGDVIVGIDGQDLTESMGADEERDFDLDESIPVQRLLAMVEQMEPGQRVEIEFERDGRRQTTVVEAEDLSDRWGAEPMLAFDSERLRDQIRSLTEGARDFRLREDWRDRDGDVRLRFDGPGQYRFFGPGDAPMVMGGRGFFQDGLEQDGLELVELNSGLGAYFGADEGVLVASADPDSSFGLEAGDVVLAVGDRAVTTPERFRRIVSSYGDEEAIDFRVLRNGTEQTVTGQRRYR